MSYKMKWPCLEDTVDISAEMAKLHDGESSSGFAVPSEAADYLEGDLREGISLSKKMLYTRGSNNYLR